MRRPARPVLLPTLLALAAAPLAVGAASPAGSTPAPAANDPRPVPPVTVTTDRGHARGKIFVSPYGASDTYANGAEILSPDGTRVQWFHATPAGQEIADFRPQTYRGRPVLTFWEGTGLGGLATGVDHVYDRHYREIATVRAGNGYAADGHEFLITRRNTALVLAYATETADLTAIGGRSDQKVIDGIVQEVNIRTGRVLFQWKASDHVPYSESQQPLPASSATPWDWFHVNAVKPDGRHRLLIDARNTWTAYDVDRRSGAVAWKLGGKHSSFALRAAPGQTLNPGGTIFAFQHDTESHGHGVYTVFDNEAAGTANTGTGVSSSLPYSRTVTIKIDRRRRTATLVGSDEQPQGRLASSQGNTQRLGTGGQFVGWGSLPSFSEFGRRGRLLFDARFPDGVNSYRAYRAPWHAAR